MSTLVDLKDVLDKTIKEQGQLESANKQLSREIAEKQDRLGKITGELDLLEKKKKGLESEIKESRSAMLFEIDKKNTESESLKNYVVNEKRLVNDLKLKNEEESKALESQRNKFGWEVAAFNNRVEIFKKALQEASK